MGHEVLMMRRLRWTLMMLFLKLKLKVGPKVDDEDRPKVVPNESGDVPCQQQQQQQEEEKG